MRLGGCGGDGVTREEAVCEKGGGLVWEIALRNFPPPMKLKHFW